MVKLTKAKASKNFVDLTNPKRAAKTQNFIKVYNEKGISPYLHDYPSLKKLRAKGR